MVVVLVVVVMMVELRCYRTATILQKKAAKTKQPDEGDRGGRQPLTSTKGTVRQKPQTI